MTASRTRPIIAWIAIAACVPLGVLLAIAFARVTLADYEIHQQKQSLVSSIAHLRDENARLIQRASYLKSDTGIELLAREQLGWVRPGETAIIVSRDQELDVGVASTGALPPAPPAH